MVWVDLFAFKRVAIVSLQEIEKFLVNLSHLVHVIEEHDLFLINCFPPGVFARVKLR